MNAKSIFAASLLVAGAAFAGTTEVTNDLVIGVLPVPLAAGQKEAILSIPWIEAGTNTSAEAGVAATNLIKTATLTAGDTLQWYNPVNSRYEGGWVVDADGQWKAANLQSVSGVDNTGSDAAAIKRGQAVVLTRNANFANATNVYIVGQYTSNPAGTTTFAKATTNSAGKVQYTYTLAAPPQVDQIGSVPGYIELNSNTWNSVGRSDTLITALSTTGPIQFVRGKVGGNFYWGTNKWVSVAGSEYLKKEFDPKALIPIGKGFWYKSTLTNSNVTVKWATAD